MSDICWKSIKDIDNKVFFIPTYQRGFRWKEIQIKQLMDDLVDFFYLKSKEKTGGIYSLQELIVKKIDKTDPRIKGEDREVLEVIDGQQRLTAIWLIQKIKMYFINKKRKKDFHFSYNFIMEEKSTYEETIKTLDRILSSGKANKDELNELLDNYIKKDEVKRDIDSRFVIKAAKYLINDYIKIIDDDEYDFSAISDDYIFKTTDAEDIDYQFIWQELSDDDGDPIEKFAKINSNKLLLTESELIKSIIYQGLEVKKRVETFGAQWERIERSMNDDDFWGFFISKQSFEGKYNTRMDYLFEVYKSSGNGKNEKTKEKNSLDKWFVEHINEKLKENKDNKITKDRTDIYLDIWNEIVTIHDTLRDWYADFEMYHLIGYLTLISKKKSEDLIKSLYSEYKTKYKDEYIKELKEKIKKDDSIKLLFANNPKSWEEIDLSRIERKDSRTEDTNTDLVSKAVEPVLLLFNIALQINTYIRNGRNEIPRFPFKYYKNHKIAEEHINSAKTGVKYKQTDLDKKDKKGVPEVTPGELIIDAIAVITISNNNWSANFDKLKSLIVDENGKAIKKIDEKTEDKDVQKYLIKEPISDFFDFYEKIYKSSQLGCIGNLTLLDPALNSRVGTKDYSKKSDIVLNTYFGLPDSDGVRLTDSIVFPGTLWVFSRPAEHRWTFNKRYEYENQIKNTVWEFYNP